MKQSTFVKTFAIIGVIGIILTALLPLLTAGR